MANWVYVLAGIYMMAMGLSAKSAPGIPGVTRKRMSGVREKHPAEGSR